MNLEARRSVSGFRFLHHGDVLLTVRMDYSGPAQHALLAWDVGTWQCMWGSALHFAPTAVVVATDETWVATVDHQGVGIWDTNGGAWLGGIPVGLDVQCALPGDRLLALWRIPDGASPEITERTRLVFVDTKSGAILAHVGVRDDTLRASADGARIATLARDGEVTLRDASGHATGTLAGVPFGALAFRGRELLAVEGPTSVDTETGALATMRTAEQSSVHAHALSADGRWLATAHGDQPDNHWFEDVCVRIWDLEARRLHRRVALDWPGLPDAVTFTRDGRVLVAAGSNEIVVWELAVD